MNHFPHFGQGILKNKNFLIWSVCIHSIWLALYGSVSTLNNDWTSPSNIEFIVSVLFLLIVLLLFGSRLTKIDLSVNKQSLLFALLGILLIGSSGVVFLISYLNIVSASVLLKSMPNTYPLDIAFPIGSIINVAATLIVLVINAFRPVKQ